MLLARGEITTNMLIWSAIDGLPSGRGGRFSMPRVALVTEAHYLGFTLTFLALTSTRMQ
jgi:hypothetical protein